MDEHGQCTHCHCHWTDHFNSHVVWEPCQKKIEKDVPHLRTQYGDAVKGLDNTSVLITSLLDDLLKTVGEFEACQKTLKRCNAFLERYAYRKKAYFSVDYQGGADCQKQIDILQAMVDRQEAI